ncbi:MAG: type IIL restriction-modification enzyme MmeI, partial [Chloroflexota bacterium]
MLTGAEFAAKWRVNRSKERSAAQEHFIDLCQMLGVPTPNEADPSGENYAFEKGASKLLGGQEWADVWKRGCFAIEYKGKHADLNKAYQQLQQYRESLQSPPLLITCDLERIVIHTNFTSTVKQVFEVTLEDIEADQWTRISGRTLPPKLSPHGLLRLIFTEYKPEAHPLRSDQTIESVTILAAKLFGDIAAEMQKDHENPQQTAHFLIRVLFCLFAEDVGLLPRYLFREMLEASGMKSKAVALRMKHLFQAMRDVGIYGNYDIKHFNGGLFDGDVVLEIDGASMTKLRDVSDLDWSAIEPSIFGTLFERGLDPAKRSQLGAHYTSRDDINLIVEPVLMAPLRREWDDT